MKKYRILCIGCLVLMGIGAFSVRRWYSRQQRLCPLHMMEKVDDTTREMMEGPLPEQELMPILSQPLFFLGKGKQSVAYETADGRYVVKFFKNALKKSKQKKVRESIEGSFIALRHIPEQTATIACSSGNTCSVLPAVTLLSKKGKVSRVHIQKEPFIVQKKAQPFKRTLMRLLAQGKKEEAERALLSLFDLLRSCQQKGVIDTDGSLIRKENMGLLNGRAVLFDTGKLHLFSDIQRHRLHDLNRLKPLRSWLEEACPELLETYRLAIVRAKKECRKNNKVIHVEK